jgi:hypothetical protein
MIYGHVCHQFPGIPHWIPNPGIGILPQLASIGILVIKNTVYHPTHKEEALDLITLIVPSLICGFSIDMK